MEDKYLESLLEEINKTEQQYDKKLIVSAYETAKRCHGEQKRESGEPYITHPVEVAKILIQWELDTACVVASLLHDTVEDTALSIDDIKKEYGLEVAELVGGVTKLERIPYTSKEEEQVENLRKMFLATAKDARVIIIKLADRLHNMRTVPFRTDDKRRQTSLETMEVYAPLAHRLGMQRVKIELEDISLRYLDPVGYDEVEQSMKQREEVHGQFLNAVISRIKARFDEIDEFKIYIDGRIKHVYSIYRKMYKQNKTIDEIYDLYAIRIIVENINDCYNTLGVIHDMFKPIPGRFKDYISTPKPNMYQSLHTTVIGKEGQPFEVQIRTWEMHRTAEYGIAAHWKYKGNIKKKDGSDKDIEWVRRMLEGPGDAVNPEDFMRSFKIDFFSDEVFVFTPKGDVVNLPAGATVIDFAYAIHSAVGNKMMGAKINGKMVQLDYQPANGDIVEILTSGAGKGPSRDWLSIARTAEAKNKIKNWFKKERREENIQKGMEELDRELKVYGINVPPKQKEELLSTIIRRVGINNVEDLYATIGYGGIAVTRIMPRIREEYQKNIKPSNEEVLAALSEKEGSRPPKKPTSAVIVEGIDNCLIKYARCCNPLPGDDIIGYVTKGYGISIHRQSCKNVLASLEQGNENERWLSVHWTSAGNSAFQASLSILCVRKYGILADITVVLAQMKVFIHTVNARELPDKNDLISLTIDVHDTEHLRTIVGKLESISGVIQITRGE